RGPEGGSPGFGEERRSVLVAEAHEDALSRRGHAQLAVARLRVAIRGPFLEVVRLRAQPGLPAPAPVAEHHLVRSDRGAWLVQADELSRAVLVLAHQELSVRRPARLRVDRVAQAHVVALDEGAGIHGTETEEDGLAVAKDLLLVRHERDEHGED